jgi:hypothetical protein
MTIDPQREVCAEEKKSLYRQHLPEKVRKIFDDADGDPDLEEEIRIFRTLLVLLSEAMVENDRSMVSVMNALIRAITLQAKRQGGTTDLERWLEEITARLDEQTDPQETEA